MHLLLGEADGKAKVAPPTTIYFHEKEPEVLGVVCQEGFSS